MLVPATRKKRSRRNTLRDEQQQVLEEQCSSGDPQPPRSKSKRSSRRGGNSQHGDVMASVRRVSNHVFTVMLPQLEALGSVSDDQVAEQAMGMWWVGVF